MHVYICMCSIFMVYVCVWFSKLLCSMNILQERPCPLSKSCKWRDKQCWVKQSVLGAWEVLGGPGWNGGARVPRADPPVCVPYRMLLLAEQIRLMVSSWKRQNKEGPVPLCGEPAGEHGWKAQLSVRLGAGGEVRAECPLFLWALREPLWPLRLGRRMHWSGSKVVCHQRRSRDKGSPSQEF